MSYLTFKDYDNTKVVNVENGRIVREYDNGQVYIGSEDWKVTGFIIVNNFGYEIKRLSLQEFYGHLMSDYDSLFYKNGKAKFRVLDFDHGTNRIWDKQYKSFDVKDRG